MKDLTGDTACEEFGMDIGKNLGDDHVEVEFGDDYDCNIDEGNLIGFFNDGEQDDWCEFHFDRNINYLDVAGVFDNNGELDVKGEEDAAGTDYSQCTVVYLEATLRNGGDAGNTASSSKLMSINADDDGEYVDKEVGE